MKSILGLSLFLAPALVNAHGEHGKQEGESIQQYAQRHMSTEHHIDSFDLQSFFHLHDLNRDGVWDREEIEAVYGVHHIYNKKKSKDEVEHQQRADFIVDTVLNKIDTTRDGRISLLELEQAGLDALPNFDGAEGHHYDVESEFFLHHEEQFHNTPETQTDESYTHPEDLEHFAHHEEIERKEAEKEAQYEGITVEEALAQHEHDGETVQKPTPDESQNAVQEKTDGSAAPPAHPHDDQAVHDERPSIPNYTRAPKPDSQDPVQKFRNAKKQTEAQEDWGMGSGGYKTPKSPAEKMRKNVPYKYKFKRSWGDF